MNSQIQIIGDGNCLFRCFSCFLYNSQNFHMKVRKNIVDNVFVNWENYKFYILGSEYYKNILNKTNYLNFMSKNTTYGTKV